MPAWKKASHKDWEAERMAVYAAQVDCLDRNIGRVLRALREAGAENNTLVFFLSDNGASHQTWGRSLDQKGRTWRLDGTPTKVGSKPTVQPGPADHFVCYGPPWANVSNAPFRNYKATVHEGGIATPLIVRWPQVISKGDAIAHQVGHITDIMATCLDVAGVEYPAAFTGRKVLPLEGKSLLPIFHNRPVGGMSPSRVLCWDLNGNRAVRMGKWKLVAVKGRPWELYDMEADRTETSDLAEKHPERVEAMAARYQAWRGAVTGKAR